MSITAKKYNFRNQVYGSTWFTLYLRAIGRASFYVFSASFFQINPAQALQLYQKALELSDLQGHEMVLDAFCEVVL